MKSWGFELVDFLSRETGVREYLNYLGKSLVEVQRGVVAHLFGEFVGQDDFGACPSYHLRWPGELVFFILY